MGVDRRWIADLGETTCRAVYSRLQPGFDVQFLQDLTESLGQIAGTEINAIADALLDWKEADRVR